MVANAAAARRFRPRAAHRSAQGRVCGDAARAGTSTLVPRSHQAAHRRSILSTPVADIIVVNWNSREDTLACLAAVSSQLTSDAMITVVDNGSTGRTIGLPQERNTDLRTP